MKNKGYAKFGEGGGGGGEGQIRCIMGNEEVASWWRIIKTWTAKRTSCKAYLLIMVYLLSYDGVLN